MRARLFALATAFGLAFTLVSCGRPEDAGNAADPNGQTASAKKYIVVLKDGVPDSDGMPTAMRASGIRIRSSYRYALHGYAAEIPDALVPSVRADPSVAFVSEDRPVSVASAACPTTQTVPTGIRRIGETSFAGKGAGVNVAVIDTGVDWTQPDLAGVVVGGINCADDGWNYGDMFGHGTHVSGTIAAQDNGFGVVGIAPGAKIWSVRVLNAFGSGSWSSVICGLDFVASRAPANNGPIQVANMSLGGFGTSDNDCGATNADALHLAICHARDAGVTIVVAAGNNGGEAKDFVPAAYDDAVITVSALADSDGMPGGHGADSSYGPDDTFATFSNYGPEVDIGAPGVDILSTFKGGVCETWSGTSMATPHVVGAVTLRKVEHPCSSWSDDRDALRDAGEPLGSGHTDPTGKHPEPVLQLQ